jgi:hypothetical protein
MRLALQAGLSDAPKQNKKLGDSTMKNKYEYNFAARAALFALAVTAAFALNTAAIFAQALPGSLWYNGDYNGVLPDGVPNERNTVVTQAAVYDDFIATGNWHITSVYSNDHTSPTLSLPAQTGKFAPASPKGMPAP